MGRGIRQGWPLSPYLFLLRIGRLSHNKVQCSLGSRFVWEGRGPSYLPFIMFADDILLFAGASPNQMEVVKDARHPHPTTTGGSSSLKKSNFFKRLISPIHVFLHKYTFVGTRASPTCLNIHNRVLTQNCINAP